MNRIIRSSSLALALSVGWIAPAHAAAAGQPDTAAALAAMQARLDALDKRVETLEGQLETANARADAAEQRATAAQAEVQAVRTAMTATPTPAPAAPPAPDFAVNWKGAPEITGKGGWSFKPRGRIHFDSGVVSSPGALESVNLGYRTRVRRARLGFEGTVPGGFGYKLEADFANASVAFGDVWITYAQGNSGLLLRVGNFESLNSLDQISSSNFVAFIERASFNDAFVNARRLGAAVAWRSANGDWRAEAGLFAGHALDSSLDNDGLIGAARLVFAPQAIGGQLHLGVNFQYRDFASNIGGGTSTGVGMSSTNQLARYRARPGSQLTDVRFVDTGSFAAEGDTILGLEFAAVFKKFYFAGEAQWLNANAYTPGALASGLDSFSGGNVAVVPTSDPSFFGAYGEVGYFFTGETRGYKRGDGTWSRTKVLTPLGKGGFGALQLALRYDFLDLADDALIAGPTNNFTTGITSLAALATRQGRGGTQSSYVIGLNWYPNDYVRVMINYGRVEVEGGPLAASVDPLATVPVNQRRYGVDVLQTRLQFDF